MKISAYDCNVWWLVVLWMTVIVCGVVWESLKMHLENAWKVFEIDFGKVCRNPDFKKKSKMFRFYSPHIQKFLCPAARTLCTHFTVKQGPCGQSSSQNVY